MSTRSTIARVSRSPDGFTFRGAYHHWDGYPTALGKTLFEAYHGHFGRDVKRMLQFLIDEHPAGWSSINQADFALPAGFDAKGGPKCYCHGSRSEGPHVVTEKTAAGCGCEWAYLFDEEKNRMYVCSAFHRDGNKAIGYFGCGDENAQWLPVANVDLNGAEPDWEAIDSEGTTARRPMLNFV